jgi:membrane peptidoglycan carboxypeptidase
MTVMKARNSRSKKGSFAKSRFAKGQRRSKLKYRRIKKYSSKRKKTLFGKKRKSKKKLPKGLNKALGILLGIGILGVLGGIIFVGATLASVSKSLPDPDELLDRESAQSTKIYDSGGPEEGTLLYTVYGEYNREFVEIDEIPDVTKWALLSGEDIEFYDHKGVDLLGLAKATVANIFGGFSAPGASTITQQLVRNTLLYDFMGDAAYERTIMRKLKEILITIQLEKHFDKDEILQMYMNEVALGGTNYGFQAAAKAYFGKDVSELTLAESAILVGIIQAPSYYSPLYGSNPEEAVTRQHYVLDQMYDNRKYIAKISEKMGEKFEITEEIIEEAKNEEIAYNPVRTDIKAPHFVFYVKQQLVEEYGQERVERGGLKVTTSLDYDLQQIAEEEIQAGVERYKAPYNVNNGGLVAIDPRTGHIKAMVGSVDYWADPDPRVDGNVNVTTALRQMGSSVKPYTYLTAFHQGYSPALLTPDIPMDFGYDAQNWDDKYRGLLLARQALVESRNIPALYTLQLVGGVTEFMKTAETLGITTLTSPENYGLSITLGAAEMKLIEHTAAYGVFANGGVKQDTTTILKVEASDGEVLQEWKESDGTRVWDEKEVYLLNWTICDLGGQGRIYSNYYSAGNQRLCGKTGTTDGPRDLTTVLYYPNLVVGVWTGNNNNDVTIGPSGQAWSTTVPLPIANSFMNRVIGKFGSAWYTRPAGIVSGEVCKDTGLLAEDDTACDKVASVFVQGHVPETDHAHDELPICKSTGLIAANEDEAAKLGLIEYTRFVDITLENEDQQSSLEKWLAKSKVYKSLINIPDSAECPLELGPDNAPIITIESPATGSSYAKDDILTVQVDIKSLSSIAQVQYYIDDDMISTSKNSPFTLNYQIPSDATDGSHTLKAIATDSEGKTGEASITVIFEVESGEVSISITDPEDGNTITSTSVISAFASGSHSLIQSTIFRFIDTSDSSQIYNSTGTNNGGSIWTAGVPAGLPNGNYSLLVIATLTDSSTITSSAITVTKN